MSYSIFVIKLSFTVGSVSETERFLNIFVGRFLLCLVRINLIHEMRIIIYFAGLAGL